MISSKTVNFDAKILNLVNFADLVIFCESSDFCREACGRTQTSWQVMRQGSGWMLTAASHVFFSFVKRSTRESVDIGACTGLLKRLCLQHVSGSRCRKPKL